MKYLKLDFNLISAHEFDGKSNFGFYLIKQNLTEREKALFKKIKLDEIQSKSNFTEKIIFISRYIIYEDPEDFIYSDYKNVSSDLINFCELELFNFNIQEINENNFYTKLSNSGKPWIIKFIHYETFKKNLNYK